ncbi:hypothetical protein AAVH_06110 [Aphelenchoides avenae]|nr:hypothetical protein AAVH_06110 [Aphelenchus avenae]
MSNSVYTQFYKVKLSRALEDLGVSMFDYTDIAGLQEDIAAVVASVPNPQEIVWFDESKTVKAHWLLKEMHGVTAGLGISIRPEGNQFRIAHNVDQPTLLWITVMVKTAKQSRRRHYIRWATKAKNANVWAPWIEKCMADGEDGAVAVFVNTIPLQLAQLKQKVDNITDLVLKLEAANMDARTKAEPAEPSVLDKIAQELQTLAGEIREVRQLASLNTAVPLIMERLHQCEQKEGQFREAILRNSTMVQELLRVNKSEQPSFSDATSRLPSTAENKASVMNSSDASQ